jgi:preprotein translocase subunit YajC
MNALFLLLMGAPGDASAGYMNFVFIGLIFVVFYFFIIRPQNQKQKEIQEKVSNLEKGDKVVTSGGMLGNCVSVDDDSVLLEIDKNVKARFLKSAITDVNPQKDNNS